MKIFINGCDKIVRELLSATDIVTTLLYSVSKFDVNLVDFTYDGFVDIMILDNQIKIAICGESSDDEKCNILSFLLPDLQVDKLNKKFVNENLLVCMIPSNYRFKPLKEDVIITDFDSHN